MKIRLLILFVSIFLLVSACVKQDEVPSNFEQAVNDITAKYAPDKRISLFNVEYTFEGSILKINAETDIYDAIEDLKSAADNLLDKDTYELNISKLPSPELGDSIYAIVNVSVANMRKTPSHFAELIDQSLMGSTLKILKKKGGWYLVQTPYNYLGWTGSPSFVRCTKNKLNKWENSKKIQVVKNYAQVLSSKIQSAYTLCDAVFGSLLKHEETSGSWYKVTLPDGKSGFIEKKYCKIFTAPTTEAIDFSKLLLTAKSFLGIPYLWGGNSSKGFDCSGFSQTVYKSQGLLLPRDANMQVNLGDEIKPNEDFGNVRKGDLVFFGSNKDRITHVAISLGGPLFIHSSGTVHINSFNKDHDNFDKYRFETLRYIKRIVKE